ncbi:MAG TPA: haloacid dehalogenase type II [Acidimicrobiia bacterium]|nr:haloacid dehalogenase type II [Acidimicrobiia bacterium]
MDPRPSVLVFDVNETLLDLRAFRPQMAEVLGSADLVGEWFARLLHGSLLANELNRHRPFGQIGVEVLMTMARNRGLDVSEEQALEVVATLRALPAHPDAAPGLGRLQVMGFRLVTLTNGSADAVADQLEFAGLAHYFERSFSVDAVERFKPAAAAYEYALAELEVPAPQAMMVAAHDWDIMGARQAGLPGAFLARSPAGWRSPDPPPPTVASDLEQLATLLETWV